MWRPKDWEEIKVSDYTGTDWYSELTPRAIFEAGADAMHQADIKWLKKHTISKPTDRFKVISIHEEEWRDFTKEAKE